ncbi:MAG: DUF4243 domain-containing protein [Candidatus Melainabacteria bacterium]|nr:DUF4243 domain-containing protein [Candidatus Melainabacteria bacterium]
MPLTDIQNKVNGYQNLAPEYGNFDLTNHLPMAQFALFRIGANDADLNRFTNYYIDLHGLGAAASATGLDLQEAGMAYLADAHLELHGPLPNVSDSAISLHDQMNYVSEALSSGRLLLPDLEGIIFQKMNAVSQPEVLAGISDNLAITSETTLKDFADLALNIYLSTKDFTTLHMVTSSHASRIMMPYVKDKELFLKYFYQAFLAAYLTVGAPAIASHETSLQADEKLIEEIKAAAQKASDDHDIKLTYTALEEHRAYQNNLYLRAAIELYPELNS